MIDIKTHIIGPEISVKLNISPETLARIFWEMDSNQQAEFFNALSRVGSLDLFDAQMSDVRSNPYLMSGGKIIMQLVGEK